MKGLQGLYDVEVEKLEGCDHEKTSKRRCSQIGSGSPVSLHLLAIEDA